MSGIESRGVAWHPVALFVAELLAQANTMPPAAGTPAWRALDDADPRKLLAVAVAGVGRVIDWDDNQQALAEASRAVAGAADWRKCANEIRDRRHTEKAGTRIPRKAS